MPTTTEIKQLSAFEHAFYGMLYSLLSWDQLSEFWSKIDPTAGWYIYAIGEPVPQIISSPEQVSSFIERVDSLLHRDHHEDYCGIVYADDLNDPQLIKIYDPSNLGSSCGSSKNPPLPGWIMSRMPPDTIHPKGIIPANRKRWWEAFISGTPIP